MVAKSYQNLEQLGEPFEKNGKIYVVVRMKSGKEKEVRWYSIDEYCKLYPTEDREKLLRENDPYWKPLCHTLMGDAGFIWVVQEGEWVDIEDFRAREGFRYNTYFGWYILGDCHDIDNFQMWLDLCKVTWEEVSIDENTLLPMETVIKIIDKKCKVGKAVRRWH